MWPHLRSGISMKRGLRGSIFTYSLDKTLPQIYTELLECAYKYIHVDEGASDRRQIDGRSQKKKQKKSEALTESSRLTINKQASPQWRSPKPNSYGRYDFCTPLSTLRAQILMKIKGEEYLRHHRPMKVLSRSYDRKKYCWFHRDHDHDTEQCIQLRDEIEALIRWGYLEKFWYDRLTQPPTDQQPQP